MFRQSEHRDTSTLSIPSAHPTNSRKIFPWVLQSRIGNFSSGITRLSGNADFQIDPMLLSTSDVTKRNLTTSNTKLWNKNGKSAQDIPSTVEMQHGRRQDLPGNLTSVSHESCRTEFLVLRLVWGTWPSSSFPFLLLFLQEKINHQLTHLPPEGTQKQQEQLINECRMSPDPWGAVGSQIAPLAAQRKGSCFSQDVSHQFKARGLTLNPSS